MQPIDLILTGGQLFGIEMAYFLSGSLDCSLTFQTEQENAFWLHGIKSILKLLMISGKYMQDINILAAPGWLS